MPAACAILAVPTVTETTEVEVVEVETCSITNGQVGEEYLTSNKDKKD